ncbi:vacuolar protein sorting-associated protein 26B-like [Sitodiplosis mosellana]|uniref:vacuolar protein sorting-associated protein 26B-like n=1 Tax=Sitodiplosis mosellana TaxID=263140 RepID=UPI002443CA29|nr:vacuolar protein sorting-associated protein 26B-like [Sitodiplosis mosellana]XP_055317216.1 vacuolar protein sorting-associated protein 26B-like [Sitodiplosis mosellana]XP_055317217.1 vacuolar protein sorting-associated protein 26B-like [Sitodiplosis mosellana]XP_055317218.1 vacuolar protein sorting-associated protein 26B-like [Sitodiplosis mosellana]XP_055317220.1 vacuolar protein sorting-associated protein 26B-like [Sitodiplosis mosellana]XP_055317221.1 vacuolar protein sorting-associated
MNFLGFGQSADIDIVFDDSESRKLAEVKTEDGKKEKYLLYYDGETVSGKVNVTLKKPGSKLEHQGIKVELIGQIELYYDRGNHHEFVSMVKELARPGDLIQNTSYPFEFANVEKPYEVYVGSNVRLRYFLRVTIVRRISDVVREIDIAVHTLCSYPEMNCPIKMEVGIEDCLHIEFEYNKSKYHLKDVIVGKIYFLLVRIKIKHMEIAIIKRETTGSGPVNVFTENETIAKYEIMDGAPVKGESIPIRVFLAGYDLTPTMRDINKKFSVRYFLNLVLMDTEDRRYFKQQEITLWRKADKNRKSAITQSSNPHVPSHLVGSDGEIMTKPSVTASSMSPNTQNSDGENSNRDDNKSSDAGEKTVGLFQEESPEHETKSTLPLSSEDVTVSPTSGDNSSRRETLAAGQEDENVPQLERESGDGASANPTESESSSAYQRRTKTRTGSLFDDDDEEENADQTATAN